MKSNHDKESIYTVQALMRALDILDCFNYQNRVLSLSDVVNRTGLNKTTAKRLISNLTARGYLQHDPLSKSYQLGMRLFELGGIVFSSFSFQAINFAMGLKGTKNSSLILNPLQVCLVPEVVSMWNWSFFHRNVGSGFLNAGFSPQLIKVIDNRSSSRETIDCLNIETPHYNVIV